jgi:hypothetical protein
VADDERRDPDAEDRPLELPSLRSAFRRRRSRSAGQEPARETAQEPAESAESSRDDSAKVPEPVDGPELSPGPAGLPETQPEVTSPLLTAPPEQTDPPRQRRSLRLRLPGPLAAGLTGAVVGLALVGLTAGSLHLCSSMRGTPSCGKPGIFLLLAITAIAVLLGSLLLRAAGVAAPGSTSFLGVGLLVVLVLLALLGVLDQWWVVIVVPGLAILTHLAAWWLTTTYADPSDRLR